VLAAQLGIRVVLLVGDSVPAPASQAVVSALARAEVTSGGDGDGFQLTFRPPRDQLLDYSLVRQMKPFKRVVVGVLFGATPQVLIDGVVTHQQFTPSDEPGGATLTVTGSDVSRMMDLEEKDEAYPNQADFVIANRVIAKYARYGLVPRARATTVVPIQLQLVPRQSGETDLAFLRRLAERNGFVFHVEPVAPGVSTAWWGPENRLGRPQPTLTLGMGADSNVRGLHFTQDGLAPEGAKGSTLTPATGKTVPIREQKALRLPALAQQPLAARRTRLLRDVAQASASRGTLASRAAATRAPDAVTAQGEVDAARYGHALRARRLVGVRGVGASYDGLYYVRSVTHTLGLGEYRQSFTLTREGTGTTAPALLP